MAGSGVSRLAKAKALKFDKESIEKRKKNRGASERQRKARATRDKYLS